MKLIKELQENVIDEKVSLSTTLRKAKVLASLLKNDQFKKWVDDELNGYDGDSVLPDYRQLSTQSYGTFANGFQMVKNSPLPTHHLPEVVQNYASQIDLRQGIKELESIAAIDDQALHFKWPPDMIAIVQREFSDSYALLDAWRAVGRSQIEGILDAIRNRLLEFILQLKDLRPEIVESEDAIGQIPEEKVANVFKITIQGDHNVLATGTGISQEIQQSVTAKDVKSLAEALRRMNVSDKEIEELQNAIQTDGSRPKKSLGEGVKQWLGKMTGKALEGAWKVAVDTAPGILTKVISKHYGWE